MATEEIDLLKLFNTVTKELVANQAALNEADTYNHNHGDNMVKNFRVITKALKKKPEASPSEQLAYASQVLQKRSPSGSAQMYAEGLEHAAEAMRGQPAVTPENGLALIQALMGGGQAAPQVPQIDETRSGDLLGSLVGSLLSGGMGQADQPLSGGQQAGDMGDLLGSLLGGAMGAPAQQQPYESQPSGDMGDLLGSLLGGAMGAPTQQQQPQTQPGGDMGDLLGSLLGGAMGAPTQQQQPQTQPGGDMGDLIGSLLGGGMQSQPAPSQYSQPQSTDMIGSLLGSLLGGSSGSSGVQTGGSPQSGGGLNIGTLLALGMAYLQAKQQGASPIEAILKVLMSGSQMNNTAYHSQSGNLVAGTLLNTLGSMMSGK